MRVRTGAPFGACSLTMPLACAPSESQTNTVPMQDAALLGELEALQAGARDRVVHLNEASFARYASGARRPYNLVIFLTASHLLDKPQLGLRELRAEFGLLAQARDPTARLGFGGTANPKT